MLVTLRRIFGRHALARMLPDIAQRRRESDIAALGLRVGGDILHLVEEEFARVERETFLGLVAIVGIILGVGDDRDREFSVLRSEEHPSEIQSLMRISYAVFCL